MVTIALRLLPIKNSAVLEININSFSLTGRREGTSDFKQLSEFYQ